MPKSAEIVSDLFSDCNEGKRKIEGLTHRLLDLLLVFLQGYTVVIGLQGSEEARRVLHLHQLLQELATGGQLLGQDLGRLGLRIVDDDLAPLALELVVRVAGRALAQLEEVLQIFGRERVDLLLVVHDGLKAFLRELPLEDLLLDRPGGHEAVREASLLLAIAPASGGRLLVDGWVPVRIEQHEPIASNQVEAAAVSRARVCSVKDQAIAVGTSNAKENSPSSSLARKQESNQATRGIVEVVALQKSTQDMYETMHR